MSKVIKVDPEILGGTPCFAGTRVPVEILFEYLIRGHDIAHFLEQYPTVTREQVLGLLEEAQTLTIPSPVGGSPENTVKPQSAEA